MKKPTGRIVGQYVGISVSASLAAIGMIALRHALDTPQPLKSQLAGEALLYVWQKRSIFYKVSGNPDAQPLVLLHTPDIGASAQEMQELIEPLAKTYRVYAPDLLGFGLSDRPEVEYSPAMYTRLCQDFLHDVVKQPAILVASRLSCNYAVSVASEAPESCISLVLISPLALHIEKQQQSPLREYAEQPLIKTLLYPLLSTRLAFLLTLGHRKSVQNFAQFHATTHQLGAEHAVMALLAGKLGEDAARQFEALEQPVLLIWGTQALEDQRNIASLHDTRQNRQKRTVDLIQGVGLPVHQEQPEKVIAAIQRWQTEINPSRLPEAAASNGPSIASMLQTFSEQQSADYEPAPVSSNTLAPSAEELPGDALADDEPALSLSDQPSEQPEENVPSGKILLAYCMKCKKKTAMQNASEFTMKNGHRAVKGTCSICGTRITRIGKIS